MSTSGVVDFPGAQSFLNARIEAAEQEVAAARRAVENDFSAETVKRLEAARAKLAELQRPGRLEEIASMMAWHFARGQRLAW
ncbi:MAG: hypothetical protein JST54_01415 [Deltaproteobacteria bacterium]|nr:hypothetical protein [Deltaproteobacteria bacterium]